MESNNPVTLFQKKMQESNMSIRKLSWLTGESTALICYIARGLAHFPTYAQLEQCARSMSCQPEDLYTKAQLRMMYPEQFPKRKRENRKHTVHVRIDSELAEKLKRLYPNRSVAYLVNDQIDFLIRHMENSV